MEGRKRKERKAITKKETEEAARKGRNKRERRDLRKRKGAEMEGRKKEERKQLRKKRKEGGKAFFAFERLSEEFPSRLVKIGGRQRCQRSGGMVGWSVARRFPHPSSQSMFSMCLSERESKRERGGRRG
jgi:hypothetical protein